MKITSFTVVCLLGLTSATKLGQHQHQHQHQHNSNSGIWDSVATSVDDEYNKSSPKDYSESQKPKIDYEAIARKKIEAEMKTKALAQKKADSVKDIEDMNIELLTFCKTLKPSHMHKALEIKEKLDTAGTPPDHFRVSLYSYW